MSPRAPSVLSHGGAWEFLDGVWGFVGVAPMPCCSGRLYFRGRGLVIVLFLMLALALTCDLARSAALAMTLVRPPH